MTAAQPMSAKALLRNPSLGHSVTVNSTRNSSAHTARSGQGTTMTFAKAIASRV